LLLFPVAFLPPPYHPAYEEGGPKKRRTRERRTGKKMQIEDERKEMEEFNRF